MNRVREKDKLRRIVKLLLIIFILTNLISDISMNIVTAEENLNQNYGDINNREDIENFMNNYFTEKMKKYSVPGAAVVVVKDNKEVFKKGYGYSDLENQILVDPDISTFPACSVSKLFTATAIMQLYEKGKIDLDRDINDYISPYKIINKYDKRITCRNLLTHTSGIDEQSELDVATTDISDIKSQEYYFNKHPMKVITEPDTICRYSNIGYNILGYVIEKVSGISYEEYIKENILKTLDMNNSSVRLRNGKIAKGYEFSDDKYEELPFSYQFTSGSAGVVTTVEDMENFIIANLNDGKFKNKSLMKTETLEMMHNKQFSNADVFEGMGFGFIRSCRNNIEIIKHEGALTSGYTTTLFMLPKDNIGVYIATNALTGLPFNFEEEFINYFYPFDNNFSFKIKDRNKNYSKYEGSYRSYDGVAKTNIMRIATLFDEDMKIKDNKDGTLTLYEVTQGKEKISTKLIEEEDGIFAREDGRGKVVFRVDDSGNVNYVFNDVSINSFEKLKFYEENEFIIAILGIVLIMFSINLVLFISRLIKMLNYLNIIIEVLDIIGVLGAIILAIKMCLTGEFNLSFGLYFFISLLIISSIVSVLSFVISTFNLVKKKGTVKSRIYNVVLNISHLVFIWVLYYFNLLGYKLF